MEMKEDLGGEGGSRPAGESGRGKASLEDEWEIVEGAGR